MVTDAGGRLHPATAGCLGCQKSSWSSAWTLVLEATLAVHRGKQQIAEHRSFCEAISNQIKFETMFFFSQNSPKPSISVPKVKLRLEFLPVTFGLGNTCFVFNVVRTPHIGTCVHNRDIDNILRTFSGKVCN